MTLARRCAVVLAAALACTSLAGCVVPQADAGDFAQDATSALSSAGSEVRTTALVVQARLDDQVTASYADIAVTESESALGPVAASFGNVDPPTTTDDQLRERVMSLLEEASSALATARLAVRRQDEGSMRDSVVALNAVGDRLEEAKDAIP